VKPEVDRNGETRRQRLKLTDALLEYFAILMNLPSTLSLHHFLVKAIGQSAYCDSLNRSLVYKHFG